MKNQRFTVGEIVRLGLLKNHKGEPYKHKATVTKILNTKYKIILKKNTAFGIGYDVPQIMIDELNARWK